MSAAAIDAFRTQVGHRNQCDNVAPMTGNEISHQTGISLAASTVAIDSSGVNQCASARAYMGVYNQRKQATGKQLSIFLFLSSGACRGRYSADSNSIKV